MITFAIFPRSSLVIARHGDLYIEDDRMIAYEEKSSAKLK
jgi:hypothetical protein